MKLKLPITKLNLNKSINILLLIAAISLAPAIGQAGQMVDSVREAIDQIPTVSFCANANPDRIRLVRKNWTCSVNKAILVNSAASMLSLGKRYENLNNENTPQGRYLIDRLNHHYDRAKEADYQLRRYRCTSRCF